MTDTFIKTLSKRNATKNVGVYYKTIQQTTIDDRGGIKTKDVDKMYVVRYRDAEGKERLVTIGKYSQGIREAYCKKKRDDFLLLAKNNELPPQVEKRTKKQVTTLDDVAIEHYKAKALHNRSNDRAKQRYEQHIEPTLGNKGILSITLDDIEKLQQQKAKKYSPKHTNNILGELSAIYTYAIGKGVVTANPMKRIKRLKVDNKRERYLSSTDVELLLDAVKEDAQLHTFILLALNTGARVGAICKLTAKDIDFEHGHIKMLDEKNAETYTTYLKNPDLIKALRERIEIVGNKPLLDDGKAIAHLTDRIKRSAGKVLSDLFNDEDTSTKNRAVVHTLRHTFASHLAINGVPILTIQKLMNHKDINQTLRYAKLAPHSGSDALEGLYQ